MNLYVQILNSIVATLQEDSNTKTLVIPAEFLASSDITALILCGSAPA